MSSQNMTSFEYIPTDIYIRRARLYMGHDLSYLNASLSTNSMNMSFRQRRDEEKVDCFVKIDDLYPANDKYNFDVAVCRKVMHKSA